MSTLTKTVGIENTGWVGARLRKRVKGCTEWTVISSPIQAPLHFEAVAAMLAGALAQQQKNHLLQKSLLSTRWCI